VAGPEAEDFLQRMVSNDVAQGNVIDALLLTAKGRVIAPLRIWRRGDDDFLLLTEPGLGEVVRTTLQRARFAAKCEIEPEQHTSTIVFADAEGIANVDYGERAVEVLDADIEANVGGDELERLRVEAGTPAWGSEIDDKVLPAEAGLDERAISYSKGCYPGQEPIARLHFRGHVNRRLRVLDVESAKAGDDVVWNEKVVGRVTSAVPGRALAFVRTEVPDDAEVEVGAQKARAKVRPA
jgi:folate-binding protein YgfZ